ncbi:MAG: VPEID-CTERM sorting domain-containing protein [Methylomagnum sp.]
MKKLTLPLAVMATLAAGSANALVIDDFNGDTYNGSAGVSLPVLSNDPAGNSSSGYARDVSITSTGDFTDIQIDTVTNPGVYAHSQGSGVFGTSVLNFDLGGALDLTVGGTQNAFRLTLTATDLNGTFGVAINGGAFTSITTNAVLVASGLVLPAYADFLFSQISGDETTATSVQIRIDGSSQSALDISIDTLGTACSGLGTSGGSGSVASGGNNGTCGTPPSVPEIDAISGTGALTLMAGALALAGERRRRRS